MGTTFLLLIGLGRVLDSLGILLFALLFACLCLPVEVALGLVAAAKRRWWLAALYGILSIALFFADGWLIEEFE